MNKDYSDSPLYPHENQRVRKNFDQVEELVGDKAFKAKLRKTVRVWCISIGLASATFTAIGQLGGPLRYLLRLILGGSQ